MRKPIEERIIGTEESRAMHSNRSVDEGHRTAASGTPAEGAGVVRWDYTG